MRERIIIEVRGGVVQEVYSDADLAVVLVDWDCEGSLPDAKQGIFCIKDGIGLNYTVQCRRIGVTPLGEIPEDTQEVIDKSVCY